MLLARKDVHLSEENKDKAERNVFNSVRILRKVGDRSSRGSLRALPEA